MPLKEGAIRGLSNEELIAIVDSSAFSGQRERLLQRLLTGDSVEPESFLKYHRLPECEVGYRVINKKPFRFTDDEFGDDDGYLLDLRFECRTHGVGSREFEKQVLSGELPISSPIPVFK